MRWLALATGAFALTVAGGCGGSEGLNSGASSPTSVTIKHDKAKTENASPSKKGSEDAAAPATAASGFGTIKGKVVFTGTLPSLGPLFAKGSSMKEPICVKDSAIPNETLVLGEGNGVANVFIFMAKAPEGVSVPAVPAGPVIFDQHNCRFLPHALLTRTNEAMKVLNSDPVLHNTHTHAKRNNDFNVPIPGPNKTGIDFEYKKPEAEPVEVTCDIHSWMRAYHLPLDHPWAAISGPNGEFEIKNVPAGQQSFRVWQEAAVGHYLNRNLSVTIKPGETANVEIKYDASQYGG
jgi:hypothetical protein